MNWLWAAIVALFLLQGVTWAGPSEEDAADGQVVNEYRYEAIPIGGGANQKELIEIKLIDTNRGVEYVSKGISPEAVEEIMIHMDPEGRFISGLRTLSNRENGQARQEKIWRADHKAYLERSTEKDAKRKEYELPQNTQFAVDGSLLILLRSFPFNEGKEWNVFMVDFSGYAITVTAHHVGVERVLVPAGEFECYRMEIVVDIPLLHPKVTYWISVRKPNFLVKHQGKKGPFTPSYITSLTSFK
jgi:hypothetical protein